MKTTAQTIGAMFGDDGQRLRTAVYVFADTGDEVEFWGDLDGGDFRVHLVKARS